MITLRSLPSAFPSKTLTLALLIGFGASLGLTACSEDEPEELCYEEVFNAVSDDGLICGTTLQDRAALTGGRASNVHSACVALADCPDYCPMDVVNESFVGPHFLNENPDLAYEEVIGLCVDRDTDAGTCCFWALMVEPS